MPSVRKRRGKPPEYFYYPERRLRNGFRNISARRRNGSDGRQRAGSAFLSQRYRTLKTEGNFNNELGLPLTVFRLRDEDEIAVLEMGISDFGEMHRLAKIARPDTAVLTNIGWCHLENLKDRDGILKAKTEIFDFLKEDGHIVLNGDDDKLAAVGKQFVEKLRVENAVAYIRWSILLCSSPRQ